MTLSNDTESLKPSKRASQQRNKVYQTLKRWRRLPKFKINTYLKAAKRRLNYGATAAQRWGQLRFEWKRFNVKEKCQNNQE